MSIFSLAYAEFVRCAEELAQHSDELNDGWTLFEAGQPPNKQCHLKKSAFVQNGEEFLKAEYVVSYSASYAVPVIYFNIWRATGALLSLEDVHNILHMRLGSMGNDLYQVLTQQEHPVLLRPYFTVHPCHTADLLSAATRSTNILLTFLSLVSSLVGLNFSLQYGLKLHKFEGQV